MDAERLLRRLPRPMLVVGADLTVRFANLAAAQILGAPGDAVGVRLQPDAALTLTLGKAVARIPIVGRSTEFRWSAPGEEATSYKVEVTCTADDEFVAVFDPAVAEQLSLDEIQSETRTYLEGVLNHLDVGITVLDTRFCVTFMNRPQAPLLTLFGVEGPAVDLIGMPIAGCVPLLALEQWADVHRRVVEAGETVTFEKLAYPAEAPQRHFQMRVVPLSLGGALGGICITQDITRLVTLEAELVRNERMALVGQMAIALNHEINNPLLVVIGNAESLLLTRRLDSVATDALQAIVDSGQRIAKVTHRLRKIEQIELTEYVKNGPMMLDLHLLDDEKAS